MRRSNFVSTSAGALLAAAALLGATGCGSGSTTTSSTAPSTSAAAAKTSATTQAPTSGTGSTAAASTAATTTASSGAAASGSTAPGTELAVGSSATVPYQPVGASQSSAPQFKLRVTVSAIEKGKLSDFNGIKLNSTQKASTPYYVKVDIANVGAGNADSEGSSGGEGNPAIEIEGVDSSGETEQGVVFLGDFPRCEYKEPPKPFTHGKSFSTCLTFLIPGGITKAAYTGTEAYVLKPVTWK